MKYIKRTWGPIEEMEFDIPLETLPEYALREYITKRESQEDYKECAKAYKILKEKYGKL